MERYGAMMDSLKLNSCLKLKDQSLQYEVNEIRFEFNQDGNNVHLREMAICKTPTMPPQRLGRTQCYAGSEKGKSSMSKENKQSLKFV